MMVMITVCKWRHSHDHKNHHHYHYGYNSSSNNRSSSNKIMVTVGMRMMMLMMMTMTVMILMEILIIILIIIIVNIRLIITSNRIICYRKMSRFLSPFFFFPFLLVQVRKIPIKLKTEIAWDWQKIGPIVRRGDLVPREARERVYWKESKNEMEMFQWIVEVVTCIAFWKGSWSIEKRGYSFIFPEF